ncbi:MAG: hypothetical protein MHM6MM_007698 [Cercozoa sp. M6MM]
MRKPNILLTGTPGCGKTTLAGELADRLQLTHLNISQIVKQQDLHEGHDAEWDTYILDDDRVVSHLRPLIEQGGMIVDFHSADVFPNEWFDLVLVLRTDNSNLVPRLRNRGYTAKKIEENLDCEIMGVCLEEAKTHYEGMCAVQPLQSDVPEDLERNVEQVVAWHAAFLRDNQ